MKLNKRNKLVIPILLLSLLFISIGYSYLQTTLSIDGNVAFNICMKNTHKVTILGQTMTYYDDDKCSEFVSYTDGVKFSMAPSDKNGKGLYLRTETANDSYPIYYYRGGDDLDGDGVEDTLKNHVLFGGFCWKIVRTTELGGTKLIYDGVPNSSNECHNTGTASQLSTKSAYNTNNKTLADVGYMYGTRYTYTSWADTPYVYGSDVTYNGETYTLTNATVSDTIANIKTKHYTCKLTTNGTCSTIYYVYSFNYEKAYAIALTNGEKLEDIISKSFANENDSTIKSTIDTWFEDNLLSQESKLEDAVWCNDRSIATGGYIKDFDLTTLYTDSKIVNYLGHTFFGGHKTRHLYNPPFSAWPLPSLKDDVACSNKSDRLTLITGPNSNGVKVLKYPVGLLTIDEVTIAGNGIYNYSSASSYLATQEDYFLMSPSSVDEDAACCFSMSNAGSTVGYPRISSPSGVRPSIVLKKDIVAASGDGSSEHPYVVE